jgi:hypothetical protein
MKIAGASGQMTTEENAGKKKKIILIFWRANEKDFDSWDQSPCKNSIITSICCEYVSRLILCGNGY